MKKLSENWCISVWGKICEQLFHRFEGFQKDESTKKWQRNFKTGWTTGIGSGYVWCGRNNRPTWRGTDR